MKATIQFIASMAIFGTIGLVVRHIDLAASERALFSSAIGALFLFALFKLMKRRFSSAALRQNIVLLICSSIALAGNWIFLYASYDYTTIANATLGYYFAPVFVMLLAPLLLKERLMRKKVICIIFAIFGLMLIVLEGVQASHVDDMLGISFGLSAAFFYAALMMINQFVRNVDKLEWTIVQLSVTALLLMPYVFLTEGFDIFTVSASSIPFIFILGIVNTGLGFWLFFASMKNMSGQRIAMLSYVDPFVAIFISAIILQEHMTALQISGGIILLLATLFSELSVSRILRRRKMA